MEQPRALSHHNDEIIRDIDNHLASIVGTLPTRAVVEEQTWLEMQDEWEHGEHGNITFDELQIKYYDWFRWERGYPPDGA